MQDQNFTFIDQGPAPTGQQLKAVRSHISKRNRRNGLARKGKSPGVARNIAPTSRPAQGTPATDHEQEAETTKQDERQPNVTSAVVLRSPKPEYSPLLDGHPLRLQSESDFNTTLEVVDFGAWASLPNSHTLYVAFAYRESRAVFKFVYPNIFLKGDITDLFAAFCQHPVVFHSQTYNYFIMKQRMHRLLTQSDRQRKYTVGAKSLRLLNETVGDPDIDTVSGEMALLAMEVTLRDEESSIVSDSQLRQQSLFLPHMAWAEGVDEADHGHPDGFVSAAKSLVDRLGGIECIRRPVIARGLCMSDLSNASIACQRPGFPLHWDWNIDVPALLRSSLWSHIYHDEHLGPGFRSLSTILPPSAITLLTDMCIVDRVMALNRNRRMEDLEFQQLMWARSNIQHRLLSMPAWKDLENTEQQLSSALVYDGCRSAALLYSNTVLRPAPLTSRGITEPLKELRRLSQSLGSIPRKGEVAEVHIWFLYIGGMIAYRTEYRDFFVSIMSSIVEYYQITTFDDIKALLSRFIWSDCACEKGGILLWESVTEMSPTGKVSG